MESAPGETVLRSAMAVGAALLVALIFAIYLRFFQTPLEQFHNTATMEQPATGSSRKTQ
jgi:hypothetical protein